MCKGNRLFIDPNWQTAWDVLQTSESFHKPSANFANVKLKQHCDLGTPN